MNFGKAPKKRNQAAKGAAPKMTLPHKNPLDQLAKDGELSKDIEESDKKEVGTVLNLLKTVGAEADRVMGKNYYGVIVFPDQKSYETFMSESGWDWLSDDNVFIDGMALAELLEIPLKVPPIRFKSKRSDDKLVRGVGIAPIPSVLNKGKK